MNSLAVWYDGDIKNNAKIDLHINVCSIKEYNEYIEFGVLLNNYNKTYGNFNLSVPFIINEDDFEDLSQKLYDSTLISALFNETLSTEDKNKYFTVKQGTSIKFRILCLKQDNDIEFNKESNHTKIKIKISDGIFNEEKTNTDIYMRFRINKIGKIFQTIATNIILLDGYKEEKNIFEINVNMKRKLPAEISQNLKSKLHIGMINVFFMSDYNTDIIFESQDRKSARVLENHIWDKYIGYKDLEIEKVVAYQWKSDSEVKNVQDFNIFVKTLIRNNKKYYLLKVFSFIVIIGALGGILGNAITTKCFNSFAPSTICDFNDKNNTKKEK